MLKGILRWVVERELLLTVALGPLFIFPGIHTAIGLALIAGLWLGRWRAKGSVTVRLPAINACMLVLLLMLPVSLWASVDLSLSLPLFYRIVWGIALFYAVVNTVPSEAQACTERSRSVRLVVTGLLAFVAVLSLMSLVGTNWNRTKLVSLPIYSYLPALITGESGFPVGGFHPNIVAGTLAPFIPLALALAFFAERGGRRHVGKRVLLVLLAALLSLTVFLTQSRGAWLGLGMGMLVFMLLLNRRWWWLVLLCGLAVVVAVSVFWGAGLEEAFLRLDTTGSGTSRLEVWNRALYMIRDMPFTGVGLGTFSLILDTFYPSFLAGPGARIPHAHNLFLQVAVDLGLPGMFAFTILFVNSLGMTLQAYRCDEHRSFLRGLSAGVFSALIVVAVHGFFDAPLWFGRLSPLLWVLLSLGPVARGCVDA